MKRIGLLCASVALALFLAGGVALAEVINGTVGDDTLDGTSKSDSIFGYGGNDTISGSGGLDELWGDFGSDVLYGGPGNDTLQGEGDDDKLYGQGRDDELRGADGKDSLIGGRGNDRLYDRDGDATVQDSFNCGLGTDTVRSDPTDVVSRNCENVNPDGGQDVLPDLAMGQLASIQIVETGTQKRLRFDSTIVNVGAGKFEVTGRRPDPDTTDMTSSQRIYDSVGDYRDRSTTATFFYSGDGHDHWHVRDLEHYQLFQLDESDNVVEPAVGEGAKNGFCFFDNTDWGSPEPAYYTGACEKGNPDALKVTMGLSRGWADTYHATLPTQYIDITGLDDGRYRLHVTADEADWFLESDEANNFTWADLEITGNTLTVLQYGPSAPRVS